MDADQILLALVGAGIGFITFCLMRFPQMRRPQFQPYGQFSFIASVCSAFAVFLMSTLIACVQISIG